jgi:hypothetical protein
MDVEKNCPTCQHNLEDPRCGVERMRINRNEKGEWVKNVPCAVWRFKVAPETRLVDICPTCGQSIPKASELMTGTIGTVENIIMVPDTITRVKETDVDAGVIPNGPPEEPPVKKVKKRGARIFLQGRSRKNG